MQFRLFLFPLLFFVIIFNSSAQDTIIEIEEPVIIKKEYIHHVMEEDIPSKLSIGAFFGGYYNFNHYDFCQTYPDYSSEIKSGMDVKPSYTGGLNLIYQSKWLYLSSGLGYINFREEFDQSVIDPTTSGVVTNKFNFTEFFAEAGYYKEFKKITLGVTAGGSINYLLSYSGKTVQKSDFSQIGNLKDEVKYRDIFCSVSGSIKVHYKISEYFKISFEPTWKGDLWTITEKEEYYYQQRNLSGAKFGIIYIL